MRTKASIKGHPIHQILIAFPIAFLAGAFIFDVAGSVSGFPSFWITATYLSVVGICAGIIAAVPGFIDYAYSVPPDSSAKKRATTHMMVNMAALALFALGLWFRGTTDAQPNIAVFIAEALGLSAMGFGGWLGGTLVNRNFIGPEHRYANKGKWKESFIEVQPGKPVQVADKDELKINHMKLLHVGSRRIVLGRTEDGYVAFDDCCTHKGGSLADGVMICNIVQCLWHGSQFDVGTGKVKAGPAEKALSTYRVEEINGVVNLVL